MPVDDVDRSQAHLPATTFRSGAARHRPALTDEESRAIWCGPMRRRSHECLLRAPSHPASTSVPPEEHQVRHARIAAGGSRNYMAGSPARRSTPKPSRHLAATPCPRRSESRSVAFAHPLSGSAHDGLQALDIALTSRGRSGSLDCSPSPARNPHSSGHRYPPRRLCVCVDERRATDRQ